MVSLPPFTSSVRQYLMPAFFVILTSVICYFLKGFSGYQVVSLVLLFLVFPFSRAFLRKRSDLCFAATMSALIWDYFFIPPQFTFSYR